MSFYSGASVLTTTRRRLPDAIIFIPREVDSCQRRQCSVRKMVPGNGVPEVFYIVYIHKSCLYLHRYRNGPYIIYP